MALNIKDDETDRLARELAAETGLSITEALRQAVVAQLEVVRRRKRAGSTDELGAVIGRGRSRQTVDQRSTDEILGYGSDGLPT